MSKKRYTEEQILSALKRFESGDKIPTICREMKISEATFFRWKSKYAGMSKSELHRAKELEAENARLKRIVANQALEIDAVKEVLAKKW